MLQRKQTVYLLLAVLTVIICIAMPIMQIIPEGMGVSDEVYNLFIKHSNHTFSYSVIPLFICLTIVASVGMITIFKFRNRQLQMRLCNALIAIILAWYALYAVYGLVVLPDDSSMKMTFGACLPFIACVFIYLAKRGIKHDDNLVKAADRIR